MVQFQ